MSVNLVDGQEICFNRNDKGEFSKIRIKLGWHLPFQCNGIWFSDYFKNNAIECHAYMLMCKDEVELDHEDIINYCNAEHSSQSVRYLGKCLNDRGAVTEIMLIEPDKIPKEYNMIVFMADVSRAKSRRQHFGMIKNAYIKIFDDETNEEICQYNVLGKFDGMTSMLFGALCRCESGWEFVAIGEGSTENIIDNLIKPSFYEERAVAI